MRNQSRINNKEKFPIPVLGHSVIATVMVTMFLVSVVLFFCSPALAQSTGGGDPVAVINGIPILPSDLNYAMETWKFHSKQGSSVDTSGVLNRLIVTELLYQESLKHRFPGLVEEAEEKYRREVRHVGSEEKLQSTLRCNNISLQQLRQSIFRNLAINRLLEQKVYSKIIVTNDEINEFYEANSHQYRTRRSVRVRQIFIRVPPSADRKTVLDIESRARAIFQKANAGTNFESLAKKHSDDPAEAGIGSEMGVISEGNFQQIFESSAFNLNEGFVTKPIKSHKGFHIFQYVSYMPPVTRPLDEVRPKVITDIRRTKARAMISEFISSLKKQADIKIFYDGSGK